MQYLRAGCIQREEKAWAWGLVADPDASNPFPLKRSIARDRAPDSKSAGNVQGLLGAINAGLHAQQRSMSASRPLLQTFAS